MLPSLLFQQPVKPKQDTPRPLKTATVFTDPEPEGTHQEQKHTEHMSRDKGLSSRGILDYALARYLHVHTRAHTIQHRCQIPDELNMHLKKPTENACVQKKTKKIIFRATFCSSSQPTLFILSDGSPTEEIQCLSASSFRVVLFWLCQGPTETLCRGWTLDKQQWDPQPRG